MARNPNCYIDTSGYGHDRMGMLEYAVKTVGPDRVLFGSDFSINDPSTVIARVQNSFLSEAEKRKVLSENLEALLARIGSAQGDPAVPAARSIPGTKRSAFSR